MADRADPELTSEPDSSMKAELPLGAEASPTPEISEPMLDVHAPHESTHTWKDFFIHIATIVIGLLIAVCLEQSVEAIHHRHQVHELRAQMREVFANNLRLEPEFMQRTGTFRSYLLELRNAAEARRTGHPLAAEPNRSDPRMRVFTSTPSLAPYDAATQSGVIALLPSNEVRLYNRVAKQREYMSSAINEWFRSISASEDFEKQFTDSTGNLELSGTITTPDLARLSPDELLEYRKLIAAVINATDRLMTRTVIMDTMGRAILDGATDENQLMVTVGKLFNENAWKNLDAK
jgi:hypothetical protein